jgi:hypothetical protein
MGKGGAPINEGSDCGERRRTRSSPRERARQGEAMLSWAQVLVAFVLGAVLVLLWRRGLG